MFSRAALMLHSSKRPDPESDSLINQLQQQIDDMTLFLEEERINHKETKRKAASLMKDQIDDIQNQHVNTIKVLEEKHKEEMDEMKTDYEKLLEENQKYADTSNAKMRGEIEFLQGAFESYKSQLLQEMEEKWKKKQSELQTEHEESTASQLQQLRMRLHEERVAERGMLNKELQLNVQQSRKEHKKELDALTRRFANHAVDLQKLKVVESRLKEIEVDHDQVKKDYDHTCRQLTDVTRELTDTKVKLLGYERNFNDKVQEIDDHYKAQMHELMAQNTELRRQYVKKCGELFEEKSLSDEVRHDQLSSAKETMKGLQQYRQVHLTLPIESSIKARGQKVSV